MSSKTLDVLIFVPLIPAIPAIATWWLPWESWIPEFVPKSIIGPYLLYCSFAAWHFHMSTWFVVLLAVWGVVVSALAIWRRNDQQQGTDIVHSNGNRPSLVITSRRSDGKPIRATCPVCDTVFSTEAFVSDPDFPHENKLNDWYSQHFDATHVQR